ncbi:MAG TPA: isochorismatase family protein [Mesorhizobium sp.]
MKSYLSLPARKAAAVFIDLQEEHRHDPRYLVEDYDKVLANAVRLQGAARRAGIPLFHFAYIVDMANGSPRPFHPADAQGKSAFSDADDELSAICEEVAPWETEPLFIKSAASAFEVQEFEPELRRKGIEWLVISGVWTEACVDATVKGAIDRGFRVLLVKDACGSGTNAMHQTGILNIANRLYGGAVTDTDGACSLIGGAEVEVWRVQGAVPLKYRFNDAERIYVEL